MIRRVIYVLLAITVIAAGYTGFGKLDYWQRSMRVFSYGNDPFARGGERNHTGFEGRRGIPVNIRNGNVQRLQPDGFQKYDSIGVNGSFQMSGRGFVPVDSTRRNDFQRSQRGEYSRGFHNGKKINLMNVWWYMSVFALFTVLTIYLDKIVRYFLAKSKKSDS